MINVTVYQNKENECVGFTTSGHAGYADAGYDIICAGVSVLTINCINSIDAFCDIEYSLDTEQEDGLIDFRLNSPAVGDVKLLIDSLILGLKGIQNDYGNEYLIIDFKEV